MMSGLHASVSSVCQDLHPFADDSTENGANGAGFRSQPPSDDEPASDGGTTQTKKKTLSKKRKASALDQGEAHIGPQPSAATRKGPKNNGNQAEDMAKDRSKAIEKYSKLLDCKLEGVDMRHAKGPNGKKYLVPSVPLSTQLDQRCTLDQHYQTWSVAAKEGNRSLHELFARLEASEMALVVSGKPELELMLAFGRYLEAANQGVPLKEARLEKLIEYLKAEEPVSDRYTIKTVVTAIGAIQAEEDDGEPESTSNKRSKRVASASVFNGLVANSLL